MQLSYCLDVIGHQKAIESLVFIRMGIEQLPGSDAWAKAVPGMSQVQQGQEDPEFNLQFHSSEVHSLPETQGPSL